MNLDIISFRGILKPEILDCMPANTRVFHADGKVLAEFEDGEIVSVQNLASVIKEIEQ